MNICLITYQYPPYPGGVGSAIYRIAKNLAKRDVNIHIIAPGQQQLTDKISPVTEDGVTVHRTFSILSDYHADPHHLQVLGDYIIKLHQKQNFDLVHAAFLMPPGFLGAIVATEIARPLIVSVRGSDWEVLRYSIQHAANLRWVLERASYVTSVSDDLMQKMRRMVRIKAGKVISNVFDASIFDARALSEVIKDRENRLQVLAETFLRMKSQGGTVIGAAGFLRPIKGFHILLQALERVVKIHPDTRLLVVGQFAQESYKREMLRQISDRGLKRQVVFTGYVPHRDVLAWMKEMDIFAFPSLHEGSPNALLEAMACGLPIVTSRIGGIVDIVEDNRDVLLVPADDVDMLSEKLQQLVQDVALRKRLGRAAKQKIESQFSPDRETEIWLGIYRRVLDR